MAIIDTFLKLMVERRAERLVLAANRPPYLLLHGEPIELSMPALREDMLRRIAGEMNGGGDRAEGDLVTASGQRFSYKLHTGLPEWRIEVHAPGGGPPDPAATDARPALAPAPQVPATKPPPAAADEPSAAAPDPAMVVLLDLALQQNATDLFLSSGRPPRIRRGGRIVALDVAYPTEPQILGLLPDAAARRELEHAGSVDFAARWELPEGPRRVRVNLFRHLDGLAAAIRPIRHRAPQLSELCLPEGVRELANFPHGLVLVTGAAGAGKSTTLAALVDLINRTHARHIITIEDPVEYEHREIQSLIHQREVGTNVESFAAGLRAALRESPDVILLGEMRDHETIAAALTAAETGHLVFSTLHAGSASTAINRIVDVFPGQQQAHIRTQLSLSLRAVLSQRLLPSRTRGLVPAVEKLLVTPAVASGIREGKDHFMRNAMLTGSEDGMITLERSLATLVRDRLIERETALRAAGDPQNLLHLLG